eukprot:CAMPEP_0198302004 /NCGR_PEP_ID=MMETSP1449-20131203/53663_1 /TAXON_ID=420275 /ORGANISM="Attheya septentrionalis, Strain CCMP2084" /LENGTH=91 /DNA_ID=CAMNT_0044004247 /DNA_START=6 /DNA_END=278 /DNA_ORIENTATION=-
MAAVATASMSSQQQSILQMPEEKAPLQVKWHDHEGTDSEAPSPRKLKLLQHQPSFSREQIQELKSLILPDLLSSNMQKGKDANKEEEEEEE